MTKKNIDKGCSDMKKLDMWLGFKRREAPQGLKGP